MKIHFAVGARPNYMKVAPLIHLCKNYPKVSYRLLHTGQHYHRNLSALFFKDLELPKPNVNFSAGSHNRRDQIKIIRDRCVKYLKKEKPDLLVVVGDVNSTLACALAAHRSGIFLAHVEAGLRSFDETMPEEKNRKETDKISNILFTSCPDANKNLINEGVDPRRIHFVGNIMIDSLKWGLQTIKHLQRPCGEPYALLTLHRPSNVDKKTNLKKIVDAINVISRRITIFFPAHPRVFKSIRKFNIQIDPGIKMIEPLGYRQFLNLLRYSNMTITDSGGLQEETTYLGIPCITLRENTERPITVREGTNIIAGSHPDRIVKLADNILRRKNCDRPRIKYWDGNTSKRIFKILINRDKGDL